MRRSTSTTRAPERPGAISGPLRRQRHACIAPLLGVLLFFPLLAGERETGRAEAHPYNAAAQAPSIRETPLQATARVFPEAGAGVRGVKRGPDGRYYVLFLRSVWVFDAEGKKLAELPAAPAARSAKNDPSQIVFADDFDVGPDGRVYIADRAADAVKIFSASGELERSFGVAQPTAIAALPDGEVAVSSASLIPARDRPPRLIAVYDARGRVLREFGDLTTLADRVELNRYLHFGRLAADGAFNLYYAFTYFPEPTVRKYDRFGYAAMELELTSLDVLPAAQAARREIAKQERGGTPTLKPVVDAMGVDAAGESLWLALGNRLMQFDKDGFRRGLYRTYTPEGARLEPVAILVEAERILLATDALGIYEFPRPDKK
jgi:hypothetical protein